MTPLPCPTTSLCNLIPREPDQLGMFSSLKLSGQFLFFTKRSLVSLVCFLLLRRLEKSMSLVTTQEWFWGYISKPERSWGAHFLGLKHLWGRISRWISAPGPMGFFKKKKNYFILYWSVHSKATQPYIHKCLFSPRLHFHSGCHLTLSIIPCAI